MTSPPVHVMFEVGSGGERGRRRPGDSGVARARAGDGACAKSARCEDPKKIRIAVGVEKIFAKTKRELTGADSFFEVVRKMTLYSVFSGMPFVFFVL